MCGIFAILSKNKQIKLLLLNSLKQLQNRGYDSCGISILNSEYDKIDIIKYASNNNIDCIYKLEQNLKYIEEGNIGIGHTRWATHGEKNDINSHPHISYDNKIAIVHNGIIENYFELKNDLIKKNITFKSQTDSEIISNLLAFNYSRNKKNKNFIEVIKETIKELKGTWGLVIINLEIKDSLFCVRHGSPLIISKTNDSIMIGSEQSAFQNLTNNYFSLNSNDICEIKLDLNNNFVINTDDKYELKDIIKNNFDLTPYPFKYWTLKEIHEQYESSLRAINFGGRLLDNDKVRLGGLESEKEILKRIDNIILLGCGTSLNAGTCGSYFFKDLCNFNTVQVIDGSEFSKNDIPKIGSTALIFLSQSGETLDLVKCIEIGNQNDLFMIGIINVVDSYLARETHCGVYLNAGREVGVASTKSFTSQVIILSLLSVWFSQIHNKNLDKREKYISSLRNLPNDIKKTIEISSNLSDLSKKLCNCNNVFILGKEMGEGISKEGSLKIKEMTYIHAEGYNASSLKHGTFALLDYNFPVILLGPYNDLYNKIINVYEQIKSRNAEIIFITDNSKCIYENNIILPKNEIFNYLLQIIPLQFISFNIAILKKINLDFPKNLAKCVTVE